MMDNLKDERVKNKVKEVFEKFYNFVSISEVNSVEKTKSS